MRDFTNLITFLESVELQALKSRESSMTEEDFVIAAQSIWDAQIDEGDVMPEGVNLPTTTIGGVTVSWDDDNYYAVFESGDIILRDSLIDDVVHEPFNQEDDELLILEEGENEVDDYFVLTGASYDDELFVVDLTV